MSHTCKYCFQVQLHNFKAQETEAISVFSDRRDALENVEEIVTAHLKEKNGELTFDVNSWTKTHLFDLSKLTDVKKEAILVGYYVTRDVDDINKFTVWEKKMVTSKVPGVIYGQWKNKVAVHEKVFDVTIVKVKDDLVPAHRRRSHNVATEMECYEPESPYYVRQQLLIQQFRSSKVYKFLATTSSATRVIDARSEFPEEFVKCSMANSIKEKAKTPTQSDLHAELRAAIKKKLTDVIEK